MPQTATSIAGVGLRLALTVYVLLAGASGGKLPASFGGTVYAFLFLFLCFVLCWNYLWLRKLPVFSSA